MRRVSLRGIRSPHMTTASPSRRLSTVRAAATTTAGGRCVRGRPASPAGTGPGDSGEPGTSDRRSCRSNGTWRPRRARASQSVRMKRPWPVRAEPPTRVVHEAAIQAVRRAAENRAQRGAQVQRGGDPAGRRGIHAHHAGHLEAAPLEVGDLAGNPAGQQPVPQRRIGGERGPERPDDRAKPRTSLQTQEMPLQHPVPGELFRARHLADADAVPQVGIDDLTHGAGLVPVSVVTSDGPGAARACLIGDLPRDRPTAATAGPGRKPSVLRFGPIV